MEEEERGSGSGRTVFFVSCSAGSSRAQVGRELAPRTAQPAAAPGGTPRDPPPSGTGLGGTGRWGRSWSRWGRGDIGPGRVLEQVPVPQRHGIPLRVGVLSRVQVPVAVLERCRQLRGGREGLGRGGCGSAGDGGASCIPGGSVGPGGRGGAGTLHPGAVGRGRSAGGWGEDLSVGRERGSRDKIWDGWGVMENTGRAQAVWLLGRRL